MKKSTKNIINFTAMGILVAGTIIGNIVANVFETQINSLLCQPIVDDTNLDQTIDEGQSLSKQIVQEGSVLVRNDNNILPLSVDTNKKVNVFGHSAIDWSYGGFGSGMVQPENDKISTNIDLLKALKRYGIQYNEDLITMYKKYATTNRYNKDASTIFKLYEPNINDKNYYSEELLKNAKDYSDVAIVVVTRTTGEGADVDKQDKYNGDGKTGNYFAISSEEEGIIKYCVENYKKTVVIINSTNAMELGALEKFDNLACLIVGSTGTRGADGIPSLLYGELSPSGRLVDTYAYDPTSAISYNLTTFNGLQKYSNDNGKFYDYSEGIYIGYKWYETADVEHIFDDINNEFGQGYEGVVQYPFGYGLSYTNFDWEVEKVSVINDEEESKTNTIVDTSIIKIDVKVTNVGTTSGKDVVEVYLTAPYTKGGIEKSHVNLVGYEKTNILVKDESETLTIEIKASDFLSYDCYDANKNGFKGYELEKGNYQLKLMSDAHNIKKVTMNKTKDVDGIIDFEVKEDIKVENDYYTGNKVRNLFTGEDAIDGVSIDGNDDITNPSVNYISRANFPKSSTKPVSRELTEKQKTLKTYLEDYAHSWDEATSDVFGEPTHNEQVTWSKNANKKVYDKGNVTELGYLLGENYNASEWQEVLDQVSIDEALNLINKGYSGNEGVSSIGKPRLADYDGPAQIKGFTGAPRGVGFPIEPVIAATFNKKIVYRFGLVYGKNMESLGVNGTYGFGCNIHRGQNAGRNFEYFSEDTFLTSECMVQAVKGLQNAGRYGYIKHFALNEQETNRVGVYTWCTEQALREIYLKPFQRAVQEADCVAIMSSYNRVGACYAGGSEALLNGVLRKEWGFKGMIITDYAGGNEGYMNLDQALRATGDIGMAVPLNHSKCGYKLDYSKNSSNRLQQQLRETVHHVTYAWLHVQSINKNYNLNASDEDKIQSRSSIQAWEWWKVVLIDLDIFIGAGCVLWAYALLRKKEYFDEGKIEVQ